MPVLRSEFGTLHYWDHDFSPPWIDSTPVFMLHGFSRNSEFTRGWVPGLAAHRRVIRMDLRGHGRSGPSVGGYEWSHDAIIGDVLDLMRHLGLKRFYWIGDSTGALIGTRIAARYPGRVKGLVLVSIEAVVPESIVELFAVGHPTWFDALKELGTRGWFMESRRAMGQLTGEPARDDYFADEAGLTSIADALGLAAANRGQSVVEDAERVVAPTLLLSPGIPGAVQIYADDYERFARLFRNGTHISYPDLMSGMYYLAPERLVGDVNEFFARCDEAEAPEQGRPAST